MAKSGAMTKNERELEEALVRIKRVDQRAPMTISMIPGFPFDNFQEMQKAVQSGSFGIAKFSFHPDSHLLGLVSPSSKAPFQVLASLTILVPIVSIVLAFTVSHWFWLGLLYFVIGSRLTTRVWGRAILSAAHNSESAFCLLFYTSKVNAYDLKTSVEYEWQQLTNEPTREETPFEKKFKALKSSQKNLGNQFSNPANVVPLIASIFEFPVDSYFSEWEEIDTVYFELSIFCIFSHDLNLSKTENERRLEIFQSSCESLASIWEPEISLNEIGKIINDRIAFYAESATNSDGWRYAEISQNLFQSGKYGLEDKWSYSIIPIGVEPMPFELGVDWGRWATKVVAKDLKEANRAKQASEELW